MAAFSRVSKNFCQCFQKANSATIKLNLSVELSTWCRVGLLSCQSDKIMLWLVSFVIKFLPVCVIY